MSKSCKGLLQEMYECLEKSDCVQVSGKSVTECAKSAEGIQMTVSGTDVDDATKSVFTPRPPKARRCKSSGRSSDVDVFPRVFGKNPVREKVDTGKHRLPINKEISVLLNSFISLLPEARMAVRRLRGRTAESGAMFEDLLLYRMHRLQTQLHRVCLSNNKASAALAKVIKPLPREEVEAILAMLDTLDDYMLSDFIRVVAYTEFDRARWKEQENSRPATAGRRRGTLIRSASLHALDSILNTDEPADSGTTVDLGAFANSADNFMHSLNRSRGLPTGLSPPRPSTVGGSGLGALSDHETMTGRRRALTEFGGSSLGGLVPKPPMVRQDVYATPNSARSKGASEQLQEAWEQFESPKDVTRLRKEAALCTRQMGMLQKRRTSLPTSSLGGDTAPASPRRANNKGGLSDAQDQFAAYMNTDLVKRMSAKYLNAENERRHVRRTMMRAGQQKVHEAVKVYKNIQNIVDEAKNAEEEAKYERASLRHLVVPRARTRGRATSLL
ncbi:hypothetical protein CYMTET_15954 [Cymbomonas tetramitiformis]|uniref:Uncharacterized protein n=1 Tax=Cymbomonas tetramitiformis TaxID=36881 RepID=A0AAE0GDJ5_9CHLO|nr:hypothetical protein CYMTET_15954 [Cymbomonas tetramitiformis]